MGTVGRPRKNQSEIKQNRSIRTTDKEWRRLKVIAKEANMSVSRFLLSVAFDRKIVPKMNVEQFRELRRIGVNLNQIARKYNQENRVSDEQVLRSILKELLALMREVI